MFTFRLWRPRCARAATLHSPKSRPLSTTATSPDHTDHLLIHQLKLATLNAYSIRNKSAVLADVLLCYDLDVFALTESWHEKDDDLAVHLVRHTGYQSLHAAQSSSSVGLRKQRGGGVVLLYKDSISTKRLSFGISPTTFEVIGASMSCSSLTFVVIVIYRPGGDAVTCQFYSEQTAVLEQLANYICPVVVTGE